MALVLKYNLNHVWSKKMNLCYFNFLYSILKGQIKIFSIITLKYVLKMAPELVFIFSEIVRSKDLTISAWFL